MTNTLPCCLPKRLRVILDVDNTLLPRDEVQLDADVLNWLQLLRKNEIEIVLLSNNGGERLRKISEAAQIEAVSWAVSQAHVQYSQACFSLLFPFGSMQLSFSFLRQ